MTALIFKQFYSMQQFLIEITSEILWFHKISCRLLVNSRAKEQSVTNVFNAHQEVLSRTRLFMGITSALEPEADINGCCKPR
jgi:hypothetical protein